VREQGVVLEDHRDAALARFEPGHVGGVDPDGALGRVLQTRDRAQQRRLAATGRPEQSEELAVGHAQVQPVDSAYAVRVDGRQAFDVDARHQPVIPS
jgi:hypothetical protein